MGVVERFSPGELVRARGREWVVVEAHSALSLRPLTGSEADVETILPEIEVEPVVYATFDAPDAARSGGREAAQLLRDALRLSLRRGAGPFRSAGRLNFAPRAYQLAPLMMTLRQDTVRLLNADDVGVGKTIETGLILREMLDRGEIDRFTVLCPPHLVDQWTPGAGDEILHPGDPGDGIGCGKARKGPAHVDEHIRGLPLYGRKPRLHQERAALLRLQARLPRDGRRRRGTFRRERRPGAAAPLRTGPLSGERPRTSSDPADRDPAFRK